MTSKKKLILLTATSCILLGSLSAAYAANSVGGTCSKVGQSTTVAGQKLTCSLVWTTSKTEPSATPSTAATTASSNKLLQDKSFRLESITFSSDFGMAQAITRLTNTSNRSKSAFMTITIFDEAGKKVLSTLQGVVNGVGAGQTVTVTFLSSGDLPTGKFTYRFQVDTEI